MSRAITNHRTGLVQIHLAVVLAGATGLFGKLVSVNPLVIIGGRTVFGLLTLILIAGLTKTSLRLCQAKDLLVLALSGLVLAVHWFAFFYSIQVSTVAIGLLGFSSFPLFTTFLEPLVFRERLHRADVLAALFVVVGLALVSPKLDFHSHATQGLLWGVVSGFTIAVLSLLSRSVVRRYPSLTVAFYQQVFACLGTLPLAWQWRAAVTSRDGLLLLLLGVVFTGIAQWLQVASLRHLSARKVSVILGLEPVYGIGFAWVILSEVPAGQTLLGGIIICGAVLWTSLKRSGQSVSTGV